MTIARRRPDSIAALAPMPGAPTVRRPVPEINVPAPPIDAPARPIDAPAVENVTPVGRLRRCTFRRIDHLEPLPGRPANSAFEVMCLYDDADEPMALGDVNAARPTCDGCTASGIFRPDED